MKIPSGVTDQYVYFVAVDATDFTSRETGLSSFTVYRSRNGAAAAAMTTPTINETDVTNMPGVYELLLDEDMTIDAGDDNQEMVFHITHAGMAPVTRSIELYRSKITVGNTLDVTATGAAGIDWGNIENKTTANDLSGTDIQLCDTTTTNTDMLTAAAVNAEVDTALADIGLDHLISSALPTNWATDVASGSVFDNVADDGTAAYDRTTDSLQAVRDHVGNGTNLTEAGGDGDHLTAINLPNQTMDITGNLSGSVGSVTGAVGSVTGAVGSVAGNVDGSVASVTGAVGSVTGAVGSVTAEVTADITKLSGSATAADNLEASALGIISGTAQTGTLSTTVMTSDLTGYLDDELIGRVIVWTGGTAAGQASDITDYASASGTLTYTAITTEPVNNDTFVIV